MTPKMAIGFSPPPPPILNFASNISTLHEKKNNLFSKLQGGWGGPILGTYIPL